MAAKGLGCCAKFAKYFLFLFNIIFWIVGVVILAVGIWALVAGSGNDLLQIATLDTSDELVRAAAITFVAIGCIIFVTGFLGCCGAIRESACMLIMYAVIVGFIVFLQFAAGILTAVFKGKIEDELVSSMNKTVQVRYDQKDQRSTSEAWDYMQQQFHCCGAVNGSSEWLTSAWYRNTTGTRLSEDQTVPDSCCRLTEDSDYKHPVPLNSTQCYANSKDYIYDVGCEPQLEKWMNDHAVVLMGIAFGLIFIQILGVIIACCLRKNIKNLYEYV